MFFYELIISTLPEVAVKEESMEKKKFKKITI